MYNAILFAPDGEFVTDFRNRSTKQEVWESVNDMGSRWFFYPIVFVATDKTIVDTPEGLEHLKGKRINTVKQHIAGTNQKELVRYLDNGWPLRDIL